MDTNLTKKGFLQAYKKSFGNVAQSCKAVGISRQTYYNWKEKDKSFSQDIIDLEPENDFLDFLESKLVEKINNGDTSSIIFALKTKAKKRGYIERQEISMAEDLPLFVDEE